MVAGHVIDGGVDAFLVALYEVVERRHVATLHTRDERHVVSLRQIDNVLGLPGFGERAGRLRDEFAS